MQLDRNIHNSKNAGASAIKLGIPATGAIASIHTHFQLSASTRSMISSRMQPKSTFPKPGCNPNVHFLNLDATLHPDSAMYRLANLCGFTHTKICLFPPASRRARKSRASDYMSGRLGRLGQLRLNSDLRTTQKQSKKVTFCFLQSAVTWFVVEQSRSDGHRWKGVIQEIISHIKTFPMQSQMQELRPKNGKGSTFTDAFQI